MSYGFTGSIYFKYYLVKKRKYFINKKEKSENLVNNSY